MPIKYKRTRIQRYGFPLFGNSTGTKYKYALEIVVNNIDTYCNKLIFGIKTAHVPYKANIKKK